MAEAASNPKPPRRRRRWLRRTVAAALATPVLAIALFHAAVALLPYPAGIDRPPPASILIQDQRGAPLAELVSAEQQWHYPLAGDQINPHLLQAIVAVEDSRFYEHRGVDWPAVASAAWEDLSSLRLRRGASTLTMQLHRLRDPAPRSFFAKVGQAVRAEQIEKRQTKEEILVEYLNRAPFGGNLVGAEAASRRYFNIPCRALSLSQAALLAGLPQNPNRFRPDRHADRAKVRRDHVLDRMLALGMISSDQCSAARAEPVDARWYPLPQSTPEHRTALPALLAAAQRAPSWLVQTTLDSAIQRQADAAAREQLQRLAPGGVRAVCVVILDTPTGRCLATVSLSPDKPNLDLAAAPRSSGSALKPFIYAAAFEAGIAAPETILRDSPAAWPGYVPENYDHDFRGSLSASEALAQSRNIPALLVLSQVGVHRATGLLQSAGLVTLARRPRPYGLSLAIGGAEATPMELAAAYATLGRGGSFKPATLRANAESPPRPCLLPSACWQTVACLSEPARTTAISPEAARIRAAWKTGTSSGHRDAWCAAVTPRRTVVVWMGAPAGQGSRSLVGAEAAAPLALSLLAALDPAPADWPAPAPSAPALPPAVASSAALTLLSPPGNTEIVFNTDQPAERQQVKLQAALSTGMAAAPAPQTRIWWFVDGRCIADADAATPIWWTPTLGSHELRASDADGHAASATLRVR